MIRRRREERVTLRKRQRRQRLLTRLGAVALGFLVAGVVALGGYFYVQDQRARQPPPGVQSFESQGSGHVEGAVAYAQAPPVGGEHAPIWQNCGFYAAPVANEPAVHALEHGAVWITYRPGLPADQVTDLRGLAEGQSFVLVSPVPDLPAPVVASAWGAQLHLESAFSPNLDRFVRAYRLGPQTREPGAACSGGTSETA